MFAVAVLVLSLAACTGEDGSPTVAGASGTAPSMEATEPDSRVRISLIQHIGDDVDKQRWLTVETNGEWVCEDCAGDGKNSEGRLTDAQNDELQRLVRSPDFRQETLLRRGLRYSCAGALYSTLVAGQSPITVGDCPGEERLPVTDAILVILADATPVQIARTVSG